MVTELLTSNAPIFSIDGERQGSLARDLIRLEIAEDCCGMKQLAARFTAWGPISQASDEGELYFDGSTFDFGKEIEVTLGAASNAHKAFKGVISAIEAAYCEGREPQIVIFAEDKLMSLRMTHRMKTYEEVSDVDIVQAIAREHGIPTNCDAVGPTHAVVQQWNISDLAFLRERARLLQAELWFQDGTLYFKTRDKRQGTELTLINGNHLLQLEARADLAHQRSEVHVSGYDMEERDQIDERASENAISSEVSSGRSGIAVLSNAFGNFDSFRTREIPLKGDTARAWAKAELLRRARQFVQVRGVTRGSPEMMVGSRLTLQRVAPPFAGSGYYVTKVIQTYDLIDGHRTTFEAERPTMEVA
jgi:phage protein D